MTERVEGTVCVAGFGGIYPRTRKTNKLLLQGFRGIPSERG